MSCDLMVFDPAAAPRTYPAFIKWYKEHTQWPKGPDYYDPSNTTPALRSWFMDMIQTFPSLNGPFSTVVDVGESPYEVDYNIEAHLILCGFRCEVGDEVDKAMRSLAEKHQLGIFSCMSRYGGLFFPVNRQLKEIEYPEERTQNTPKKPWWRFW
jgi:hypothetical protein